MRLLAVDQGSRSCGLAAFQDRDLIPGSPRALRGRGQDWLERMRDIARQLRDHLAGEWAPDVVAIEDVVGHRGHPNIDSLVTMAETRGFLMRVFGELAPAARIISIHPTKVRSAIGAPRGRKGAKQHNAWAASSLFGQTGLVEDAADAIAVGLAALEQLRAEDLERRARQGSGGGE